MDMPDARDTDAATSASSIAGQKGLRFIARGPFVFGDRAT